MGVYKTLGGKQTVGPHTSTTSTFNAVIEPEQGRHVTLDPNSDNIVGNDLDGRVSLGTYTLNNRGLWEELILNDSKTGPTINQNAFLFETRFASQTVSEDGSMILSKVPYGTDNPIFQKFSIEVFPYRIRKDTETNENVNVPLVLYYDEEIHEDDYYAATDGKVNLKIFIRSTNRNDVERNIRNYENSYDRNQYIFDYLNDTYDYEESGQAFRIKRPNGFYVMNLNWGDGSGADFRIEPELLGINSTYEHVYEKPGFYTITGVVFIAVDINNRGDNGRNKVLTWERFESHILINPSDNYDDGLYTMNNFCTIGGMSQTSAFFKNVIQLSGYNNENQTLVNDENFNELDKLNVLETIAKFDKDILRDVDGELLDEYMKSREKVGDIKDLSLVDIEYNDGATAYSGQTLPFDSSIFDIYSNPQEIGQPVFDELVGNTQAGNVNYPWVYQDIQENTGANTWVSSWYKWGKKIDPDGNVETLVVEDLGEVDLYGWTHVGDGYLINTSETIVNPPDGNPDFQALSSVAALNDPANYTQLGSYGNLFPVESSLTVTVTEGGAHGYEVLDGLTFNQLNGPSAASNGTTPPAESSDTGFTYYDYLGNIVSASADNVNHITYDYGPVIGNTNIIGNFYLWGDAGDPTQGSNYSVTIEYTANDNSLGSIDGPDGIGNPDDYDLIETETMNFEDIPIEDRTIQVTANPSLGYILGNWELDDASSATARFLGPDTNNDATIKITGDTNTGLLVIANFVEID
tara:strand:- start:4476 stop:6722 length:2247 start_codon:yes stop_codon:yes gene_type:complete